MKYKNPRIIIPYRDKSEVQYLALKFMGDVDKRRVAREVRKYCKKAFNISITKNFIRDECVICTATLDKEAASKDMKKRLTLFNDWLRKEHEQTERDTEDQDGVT